MTVPTWSLEFIGSATVTLTTAPNQVRAWGVSGPAGNPVTTESVEIRRLPGSTPATIYDHLQDVVSKLNLFFAEARARMHDPRRAEVFIRWKDASAATQWRSPVADGNIEYNPLTLGPLWRDDTLLATVTYTRANYWEHVSETAVPLENGNEATPGTPQTAAVPVFNNNDGTGATPAEQRNWVKILAANVVGDLPAPCRIQFENETAGTPRNRAHYIAHSCWPDPANLATLFEAEDATGATPVPEAGNSGGDYASYTLTASEAAAFDWPLSDAQMEAFAGGWFVPFLRMRVGTLPASSTKARIQLIYQSLVLYQHDFQTTLSTSYNLQALPALQIPPAFLVADYQALGLRLALQRVGAGTFSLDYLMLLPAGDTLDEWSHGGYRVLEPSVTYGLAKDETLVDDGMSRPPSVHVLVGGDRVPAYHSPLDTQIRLWPGRDQRVYFLWDAADGTAGIARTAGVQMSYRPRVRGLPSTS